ncbi:MAG: hypothetical protein HPY61_13740 [Methanotrichaceae archaeon]|nr:hypothetical protein [Methanotrichaceae archaeon]
MTWTYTDDPAGSPRDALRLKIGDVRQDDPLLSDQEVQYFLEKHSGNILLASIEACEALAARFARDAVEYVGDLNNSPAKKSENYLKLAVQLRSEIGEEVYEEAPPSPGYSSQALSREPMFYRGVGYGGRIDN